MTSARVAIERIDNNRGEKLVIDGSRAETYLSSGKYKEGDIELKDLLDKLRYKNAYYLTSMEYGGHRIVLFVDSAMDGYGLKAILCILMTLGQTMLIQKALWWM